MPAPAPLAIASTAGAAGQQPLPGGVRAADTDAATAAALVTTVGPCGGAAASGNLAYHALGTGHRAPMAAGGVAHQRSDTRPHGEPFEQGAAQGRPLAAEVPDRAALLPAGLRVGLGPPGHPLAGVAAVPPDASMVQGSGRLQVEAGSPLGAYDPSHRPAGSCGTPCAFDAVGRCRYGAACRFAHAGLAQQPAQPVPACVVVKALTGLTTAVLAHTAVLAKFLDDGAACLPALPGTGGASQDFWPHGSTATGGRGVACAPPGDPSDGSSPASATDCEEGCGTEPRPSEQRPRRCGGTRGFSHDGATGAAAPPCEPPGGRGQSQRRRWC